MIYGLYESAAGMMVNEYRQNVLANNIANADTVGFKRDVATFAERLTAAEAGRRRGTTKELLESLGGGTWLGRTQTDFSEGRLVRTEEPLDVAIAGPGFLRIEKDGRQLLTRDGRLMIAPDGRLVAATDGAAVLGRAGQPILLNPRGGPVEIDEDGRIRQDGQMVGWLGLVDAGNYQALRKAGAGRYEADPRQLRRSVAKVIPGFLESSGVEPIGELVAMIEASRAFQFNAQMLTLQDQTAGRLINVVAAG